MTAAERFDEYWTGVQRRVLTLNESPDTRVKVSIQHLRNVVKDAYLQGALDARGKDRSLLDRLLNI